jgi:hypothetical protein
MCCKQENAAPTVILAQTDTPLPMRANERRLMDDPISMKAKVLRLSPHLT